MTQTIRNKEGEGRLLRCGRITSADCRNLPKSRGDNPVIMVRTLSTIQSFLHEVRIACAARQALRASAFAIAIATAATPGRADVFQVGEGGAVAVRGGAGAVVWNGGDVGTSDADTTEVAPALPPAAMTIVEAAEAPAAFRAHLATAAQRYDLSPALLAALVWQESRWQPAALSSKGAIGLGQLMPATARALAVDPRVPGANLEGAAHYLRQLLDLFDGDIERALAAYNAGPNRVIKAGGVPAIAETRTYVARIIDRLAGAKPAVLTISQGAAR